MKVSVLFLIFLVISTGAVPSPLINVVVPVVINTITTLINSVNNCVTTLTNQLNQNLNTSPLNSIAGYLNPNTIAPVFQNASAQIQAYANTLNVNPNIAQAYVNAINSIANNSNTAQNYTPSFIQNSIYGAVNQLNQTLTNYITSGGTVDPTALQNKFLNILLSLPQNILSALNSIIPQQISNAITNATSQAANNVTNLYNLSPLTSNNISQAAQNALASLQQALVTNGVNTTTLEAAALNTYNQFSSDLNQLQANGSLNSTQVTNLKDNFKNSLIDLINNVSGLSNAVNYIPKSVQTAIFNASDIFQGYANSAPNATQQFNNALASIASQLSAAPSPADVEAIILKTASQLQTVNGVPNNYTDSVNAALASIGENMSNLNSSFPNIPASVQNALLNASAQLTSTFNSINPTLAANLSLIFQNILASAVNQLGPNFNLTDLLNTYNNSVANFTQNINNIVNAGNISSSAIPQLLQTFKDIFLKSIVNPLSVPAVQNSLAGAKNQLQNYIDAAQNNGTSIDLNNYQNNITSLASQIQNISQLLSSVPGSFAPYLDQVSSKLLNFAAIVKNILLNSQLDYPSDVLNCTSNFQNISQNFLNALNIDPNSFDTFVKAISANSSLTPEQIENIFSANGTFNAGDTCNVTENSDLSNGLTDASEFCSSIITETSNLISQFQNFTNYLQQLSNELKNSNSTNSTNNCTNQWSSAFNQLSSGVIQNAINCANAEIQHCQNGLNEAQNELNVTQTAIETQTIAADQCAQTLSGLAYIAVEVGPVVERFKICLGISAVNQGLNAFALASGIVQCYYAQ